AHVVLIRSDVEMLMLDGLNGDDMSVINLPQPYEEIHVHGGDQGSTDFLQVIEETGENETFHVFPDTTFGDGGIRVDTASDSLPIYYESAEWVNLYGGSIIYGDDDDLVIHDDTANNLWWVTGGSDPNTVRVTIDQHSPIEYFGFNDVMLMNGPASPTGFDRFRIDATILTVASDGDFTVHGAGADVLEALGTGQDDWFRVVAWGGPQGTVAVNGSAVRFGGLASLDLIGLEGNDWFNVDVDASAGSDVISVPINIDGGGPENDGVSVRGAPQSVLAESSYEPGPDPSQGVLEYWGDDAFMQINFQNVDVVQDEVVVTESFHVHATDGDNAINYSSDAGWGGMGGDPDGGDLEAGDVTSLSDGLMVWGAISVDGFLRSPLMFKNKPELVILGQAGSDTINLNSEYAPDLLTKITVVGSDPTASEADTVIVNGSTADDTIEVTLSASDDASITGAQPVPVDVWSAELLVIQGQGGGDDLTVITPAGSDALALTPGSEPDAGSIATRALGGGTLRLPIEYLGLGAFGSVTFDDAGTDVDRDDILEINGTAADDRFDVAANGDVQLFRAHQDGAIFTTVLIQTPGIDQLDLLGQEGDDEFDVAGNHPFSRLIVQGGDPGASDVLNFASSGGAATVDLQGQTVTEAGNGPVAYSGIETINLDAGGVTPTIEATDVDEDITVTVFGAQSGKVERGLTVRQLGQVVGNVLAPVIFYTNTGVDGLLVGNPVHIDLEGGEDTLTVVGNAWAQTFRVNVATSTVTVDDLGDGGIDGQVTYSENESLAVYGLEGDDTFNVTAGDIPVFIDGGDPIGQTAGDRINVMAGGQPVTPETGPENDEGGFLVGAQERISYDHIEALGVFDAAKAIIIGTDADDEISVVARSEQADPPMFVGADGVQDFTTSVNDNAEILWVDTPLLFIDGANGDDDITLRTPAPNNADWDVDVFVAGGLPSTPEVGDRLRVETPYRSDTVTYQPTAPDAGVMKLANAAGAATDVTIYIGQWAIDHDGDGVDDYVSSPGGVEQLLYDGVSAEGSFDHNNETGDTAQDTPTVYTDHLTVLGDGFVPGGVSADWFVHTPGSALDAGSVALVDLTNNQTMLGISYNNLGLAATVTIDGQAGDDMLVAQGTDLSDAFIVDRTAAAIGRIRLNNQVPLLTAAVEKYTLNGLNGDDRFWVNLPLAGGVSLVNVNGSGPAGSDAVYIEGETGADDAVVITPSVQPGMGVVSVTDSAFVAVNYTGLEHVFVAGNAQENDDLTVYDDSRD
ncbi:MAG TPA: hypothetical protein PLF81_25865, partial [Candidatus Anammoximicrobium sp.]|nr:hypothetical protein [Candidatus Anammoximicrobium sp.]